MESVTRDDVGLAVRRLFGSEERGAAPRPHICLAAAGLEQAAPSRLGRVSAFDDQGLLGDWARPTKLVVRCDPAGCPIGVLSGRVRSCCKSLCLQCITTNQIRRGKRASGKREWRVRNVVWVNAAIGDGVDSSWPLQKARRRFFILVRSLRIHGRAFASTTIGEVGRK